MSKNQFYFKQIKMFPKAITCFLILFLIENSIIYVSATEFVASTGKANFFQALLNCEQANMRLAIIKSEDESRLHSYLVDIESGNDNGYWLGVTNLPNKSSKVYYCLTTGASAIYTNWFPNQPDNSGGSENCLQWVYDGDDIGKGWNDFNCNTELRYIYEKNWD